MFSGLMFQHLAGRRVKNLVLVFVRISFKLFEACLFLGNMLRDTWFDSNTASSVFNTPDVFILFIVSVF
jgi:hypothetical protein